MRMQAQLHLAAQYLATAAISFLDKKDDDSHTNLGFSIDEKSILTRPLDGTSIQLGLNYGTFSLDWKSNRPQSLSLNGKTHREIVAWLTKVTHASNLPKPYSYILHYGLPYSMGDSERFKLSAPEEIQRLVRLRTLAQNVLSQFLEGENLVSDVRIWPHHFDTGAFVHLRGGSGKSLGMGMAIPDGLVDDLYFYINGYRGNDGLDTWAFPPLSHGKWVNNGFKGAVLPVFGVSEAMALQFFKEALGTYGQCA